MFGSDALTNLSQLTKPSLRYMGTEYLILDLELMSNIFQTQIHNLRMARVLCYLRVYLPLLVSRIALVRHGYPTVYQWESTQLTMSSKKLK